MNTEKIEHLLEQLLAKQDELICRIENLESTMETGLTKIDAELSEVASSSISIYGEMIWWGEGPTLGKQVLQSLADIETAIGNVESQIMIST